MRARSRSSSVRGGPRCVREGVEAGEAGWGAPPESAEKGALPELEPVCQVPLPDPLDKRPHLCESLQLR